MFNIALAGELTDDAMLGKKLDELFGQIKAYLYSEKTDADIKFYVEDKYTCEGWKRKTRLDDGHVCLISGLSESVWDDASDSNIKIETDARYVTGELLCNKSDLVVAVWNEDANHMNGATWELIQLARKNKTPCIWISCVNYCMYWSEESYYERFSPEKLKKICDFYNQDEIVPESDQKRIMPLIGIGKRLYERFMKKHSKEQETTTKKEDVIMSDSLNEAHELEQNEKIRKKLVERFISYDEPAIRYGERYNSIIYWRAILPIITTAFIAVGFYAETILGVFSIPAKILTIMAAIGFFIHGMLNLYVYMLSKSEHIKTYHKEFVNNRYIAEILRVLVHFEPYGISLNLKKLCGNDNRVYRTVKNAVDNEESFIIDKEKAKNLLCHVDEMLENQIDYHKSSAKKYEKVVSKIETYEKVFLVISFVAVVLRSFFSFAVAFFPITSGEIGGVPLSSFVGSFANMTALLLPAIASYFTTKLGQCNFKFNYENHKNMETALLALSKRVKNLKHVDERITMELLTTLGEDVATVMLLDDTFSWHRQYMSSTIKRL